MHFAQGVTLGTLQAFYSHLEQELQETGHLATDYCIGYGYLNCAQPPTAPTASNDVATVTDQIASFKEDASRRSAALCDGVVNFGYARPFFHEFKRWHRRYLWMVTLEIAEAGPHRVSVVSILGVAEVTAGRWRCLGGGQRK